MADDIQELNALVKDFIKYAEGGSVSGADASVSPTSEFGLSDLLGRVLRKGLPANASAAIQSLYARALGRPAPVFGADMFTDSQLERIRDMAAVRKEAGYEDVVNFKYPDTPNRASRRHYNGPGSDTYGIGHMAGLLFNDEDIIETSLGGYQIYDEGDRLRIEDPFDFTGVPAKNMDELMETVTEADSLYKLFRYTAPTLISKAPLPDGRYYNGEEKFIPMFSFTIPKEGPVRPEKKDTYRETVLYPLYAKGGSIVERSNKHEPRTI
jgi:hypothetical protein